MKHLFLSALAVLFLSCHKPEPKPYKITLISGNDTIIFNSDYLIKVNISKCKYAQVSFESKTESSIKLNSELAHSIVDTLPEVKENDIDQWNKVGEDSIYLKRTTNDSIFVYRKDFN